MENLSQAIEDRILEVKALPSVSSDKIGEHVLLEAEVRKVFVEAVSEGLRISENVSEFYLNMGGHLAKHKKKLKEHRVYGAACQELGLKKSTANNILKLYATFGDRVGDMISLIPVRKLLVICAHIDPKRDALIKYCQDHAGEIRNYEGADLRAWVKGEPRPEPKAPEQEKVGSFIIKKSPSKKTVIIELNQSDEKLQAFVSDYLRECMEEFESWKNNLQCVGRRDESQETATKPAENASKKTEPSETSAVDKDAVEISKFIAGQAPNKPSSPAQVIPFNQPSREGKEEVTTSEVVQTPEEVEFDDDGIPTVFSHLNARPEAPASPM